MKRVSVKRLFAIARKEFWHIIHDPRSLTIVFLLPTIQLIMFGYALNMEIQRVDLAVIDYNRSVASRHLIEEFAGSRFFHVFASPVPINRVEELFLERKARAVLVIPPDFSKQWRKSTQTEVQILIDAADPNAATNIRNYCNQIIAGFNERYNAHLKYPFQIEPRIWFNPELKSSYFFVPGLLALLLVMISCLLTSVTITREKEMGTMEQILVSPIRPLEIIIGKVSPYIFLAFLDATLILTIGIVVFEVPFRGSVLLLLLLATLYIITALSLGLMISTLTHTQQVAMMVAQVATVLPSLILSGFIFPIPSMPRLLQYVTYLIPARYFLVIVRGIMLKGNVFGQLWVQALFLFVMALLLLMVAWRKFSLNLER